MIQFAIIAAILATWAGCALGMVACGLMVRGWRGERPPTTDEVFEAFWVGLASTVAFLQLWHCVWPIDTRATVTWAVVGLVALGFQGRPLVDCLRQGVTSRPRLAFSLALAAIWIANRATGPAELNDSGSYHLAGIRWAHEHAIVPGLGNLLDMLSLNNAIFLCHALVEVGFWQGRSNHVVNGLLVAVFLTHACVGLARCLRRDPAPRPSDIFLTTLAPLAVVSAVGAEVSSPGTDLGAALAGCVSLWSLIRLAQESSDWRADRRSLLGIASTTALAITLKVSALVVAGLIIVSALLVVVTKAGPTRRSWWQPATLAAVAWIALLVPWAARGVMLSGYPLFPSTAFSMRVPWQLGKDQVNGIRDYVRVCGIYWWLDVDAARPPEMATSRWLATWITKGVLREPFGIAVPVTVAGGALCCAAAVRRWSRGSERCATALTTQALLLVSMPILGGIVFWATNAPTPRFGAWLLWAFAGCTAIAASHAGLSGLRVSHWLAAGMCLLGILAIGHRTAIWVHYQKATGIVSPLDPWTRSVWLPAGDDCGLHPYPVVKLVQRRSRWGVAVSAPAHGLNTWWAPLPATFNDVTNLRLRSEGDMAQGFVTDRNPLPQETDEGRRNSP